MNTFESILSDLRSLGVRQGDTLFLRISYKALGKTDGGPRAFLDAVAAAVGSEGTILLTAFPQVYKSQLRLFHIKDTVSPNARPKSNTGALSNVAMSYPNACLSYRLDFPFVVIGKYAEYLTKNHGYEKTGYWVLEEAIEKFDCKCLRIGGEPFIGTTHMALSHILREKGEYQVAPRYGLYVREGNSIKWRENNNVVFCPQALKNYLPGIISEIMIKEGTIGEGYAVLTDMKKSLRVEECLLREDIRKILCADPNCCLCQTTFSFSDSTRLNYILKQLRSASSRGLSMVLKRLRTDIKLYMLFTRKNN